VDHLAVWVWLRNARAAAFSVQPASRRDQLLDLSGGLRRVGSHYDYRRIWCICLGPASSAGERRLYPGIDGGAVRLRARVRLSR